MTWLIRDGFIVRFARGLHRSEHRQSRQSRSIEIKPGRSTMRRIPAPLLLLAALGLVLALPGGANACCLHGLLRCEVCGGGQGYYVGGTLPPQPGPPTPPPQPGPSQPGGGGAPPLPSLAPSLLYPARPRIRQRPPPPPRLQLRLQRGGAPLRLQLRLQRGGAPLRLQLRLQRGGAPLRLQLRLQRGGAPLRLQLRRGGASERIQLRCAPSCQ